MPQQDVRNLLTHHSIWWKFAAGRYSTLGAQIHSPAHHGSRIPGSKPTKEF